MRYLGSTKNLVGSLCGLAGVALYLFGVTGPWGLPVVVALYAVGALLAPPDRVRPTLSAELTRLRADLAELPVPASLPAPAVQRITRITETLTAVASRDSLATDPDTLHAIIRLVRTDLPLSIRTYLALPSRPTADHNAEAEFLAQLDLLEKDATRTATRFYAGDVQQQTDHTRYIRSRTEEHPDQA